MSIQEFGDRAGFGEVGRGINPLLFAPKNLLRPWWGDPPWASVFTGLVLFRERTAAPPGAEKREEWLFPWSCPGLAPLPIPRWWPQPKGATPWPYCYLALRIAPRDGRLRWM